jgi:hypothetical protein
MITSVQAAEPAILIAVTGPANCCADLRVGAGLGQRDHPHLR